MAKDPYRYFRVEARELIEGLGTGVLELERAGAGAEVRPRLLRLAHTLKGAARVVHQPEIAEIAHAIEDRLGAESGAEPVPRETIDALLKLLDAAASKLSLLARPEEPRRAEPAPAAEQVAARAPPAEAALVAAVVGEELRASVRVDFADLDSLARRASEAALHLTALRTQVQRDVGEALRQGDALAEVQGFGPRSDPSVGERARRVADALRATLERLDRELARSVEYAERELSGVREVADRVRLVEARIVFASLERAVRDAARVTGISVVFESLGGDSRIEAHTLGAVHDALLHLVRNAVAHGAEPEGDRLAAGKPAALTVTLAVERRGRRVAFTCTDDGRGIDVEAVKSAAVRRGSIDAETAAAMSDADAKDLVFGHGLSTFAGVTQLAGRGVGLDVVRETARQLKGDVSVESAPRRGTRIEICVPVSRSSLAALIVEARGVSAAIPLDVVERALQVRAADVVRTAATETILHDGTPIPFARLGELLGGDGSLVDEPGRRARREARSDSAESAVVVHAAGALAAIAIDRIAGVAPIVLRPLPARLAVLPVVAGAALDPRGKPQLVLDAAELVRAAGAAKARAPGASARDPRPILVVDDSLTTRMLEQSILESAGYEVDLATSAEEALGVARDKPYGLFVVDVEMPGMSGYEFVALTRSDPVLRETPAILVTSRGSEDDRLRGEQAGASAFIVKGEFDQVHLLDTVSRLVR